MKKYTVTGMSCAACVSRVENAVNKVGGVTGCAVNLLTNTLVAEGDFSQSELVNAVKEAGYGIKEHKIEFTPKKSAPLVLELVISGAILLVIMYASMGHMLSLPMPTFLHNAFINGLCQMILSGAVIVINRRFFVNGVKGALHLSPNMDTLVALGSGVSFIYSVWLLIKQYLSPTHNVHYYFESAAMILVLITVGKLLESYSKGKTTNALKSLMDLAPKTATVLVDGVEKEIPVFDVKVGDILIARPGNSIAVDGVIIKGESAVDCSSLTGESLPVDKTKGDKVLSGCINLSGYIEYKAETVGEDTAIFKIIKMVSDVGATKAPMQKIADKVSGVFVPVVILISLVTLFSWLCLGKGLDFSLTRAVAVLVISCPCALGLATPVAIMVGNGVAAKHKILFKSAQALEVTGKVKTVLLDKTGTITKGQMQVTDVFEFDPSLMPTALALEQKSEHPLAKAVVKKAQENGVTPTDCQNFKAVSGSGVTATCNGEAVLGGSVKFIARHIPLSQEILSLTNNISQSGKTPLVFIKSQTVLGVIAVADTVKEDSLKAVEDIKKMGIEVVMLTGDNPTTAKAVAKSVGINKVIAEVMPQDKAKAVKDAKENGKVMMVGDGVNDAVALTLADVGVAIGSGTDIAVESAEVVLVKNSLADVVTAIKISRRTIKTIYQNLFWAFLYNTIGIPLAAGVFGLTLDPMFGAAAMSLSSFCVVSNALRLNLFKTHKKEIKKMKVTLKIEGMMCPHCEAHVTKALSAVSGVSDVVASHKEGTAVMTVENGVDLGILKAVVENAGYKVL